MKALEEELRAIRNRAWSTAGARYNAARRLWTRSKLSLATISLISAMGVAIPLILAAGLFSGKETYLGLFAALLSLFILVVAVIEGASGFDVKAEALHRNAEAFTALRTRVGVALSCPERQTVDTLDRFADEYEKILDSCGVNHEYIDFALLQAQKPQDFGMDPSKWRLLQVSARYYLHSTWWLFSISLVSMAIFLTLLLA